MKRRLLALLLAVMVAVGFLPTSQASATDNVVDTWAEATATTPIEVLNSLPRDGQPIIPNPPCPGCTGPGNIHAYAYSADAHNAGSYTGFQTVKPEMTQVTYHAGCANAIYETSWLSLAASGGFLEIGTAHFCDGSRAWYGFVEYPNSGAQYNWLFNIPITGSTAHAKWIVRDAANHNLWRFGIDGSLLYVLDLGAPYVGTTILHGLETYTSWAEVKGWGTRRYGNLNLLWNGASSYWWVNYSNQEAYTDYQMYERHWSANGGTNNELGLCQNWPAAQCGNP